jgi:hypothetical protein
MMGTRKIVVRIMVRDASPCGDLTNAPLASMMRMNSVAHLICKPANLGPGEAIAAQQKKPLAA